MIDDLIEMLKRTVIALESIAHSLDKLSSTVLTVEDQRGNEYKAVATTKID